MFGYPLKPGYTIGNESYITKPRGKKRNIDMYWCKKWNRRGLKGLQVNKFGCRGGREITFMSGLWFFGFFMIQRMSECRACRVKP